MTSKKCCTSSASHNLLLKTSPHPSHHQHQPLALLKTEQYEAGEVVKQQKQIQQQQQSPLTPQSQVAAQVSPGTPATATPNNSNIEAALMAQAFLHYGAQSANSTLPQFTSPKQQQQQALGPLFNPFFNPNNNGGSNTDELALFRNTLLSAFGANAMPQQPSPVVTATNKPANSINKNRQQASSPQSNSNFDILSILKQNSNNTNVPKQQQQQHQQQHPLEPTAQQMASLFAQSQQHQTNNSNPTMSLWLNYLKSMNYLNSIISSNSSSSCSGNTTGSTGTVSSSSSLELLKCLMKQKGSFAI